MHNDSRLYLVFPNISWAFGSVNSFGDKTRFYKNFLGSDLISFGFRLYRQHSWLQRRPPNYRRYRLGHQAFALVFGIHSIPYFDHSVL